MCSKWTLNPIAVLQTPCKPILDYTRRAGGPKDLVRFWTPETAFMTPETFKIWIQNLTFLQNDHFFTYCSSSPLQKPARGGRSGRKTSRPRSRRCLAPGGNCAKWCDDTRLSPRADRVRKRGVRTKPRKVHRGMAAGK